MNVDSDNIEWEDYSSWLELLFHEGDTVAMNEVLQRKELHEKFKKQMVESDSLRIKIIAGRLGYLSQELYLQLVASTFPDYPLRLWWYKDSCFFEHAGDLFYSTDLLSIEEKKDLIEGHAYSFNRIPLPALNIISPHDLDEEIRYFNAIVSSDGTFEDNLKALRCWYKDWGPEHVLPTDPDEDFGLLLWFMYEILYGENFGMKEKSFLPIIERALEDNLQLLGIKDKKFDFSDEGKLKSILEKMRSLKIYSNMHLMILTHYGMLDASDVSSRFYTFSYYTKEEFDVMQKASDGRIPDVFRSISRDLDEVDIEVMFENYSSVLKNNAELTYSIIGRYFFYNKGSQNCVKALKKHLTIFYKSEEAAIRYLDELLAMNAGGGSIGPFSMMRKKHILNYQVAEQNAALARKLQTDPPTLSTLPALVSGIENYYMEEHQKERCVTLLESLTDAYLYDCFFDLLPNELYCSLILREEITLEIITGKLDSVTVKNVKESSRCLEWLHVLRKHYNIVIDPATSRRFSELTINELKTLQDSY